jgi:hypothetical protein
MRLRHTSYRYCFALALISEGVDEEAAWIKGSQKEDNGKYPHGFALSVV